MGMSKPAGAGSLRATLLEFCRVHPFSASNVTSEQML
jgi:hypothetical protein